MAKLLYPFVALAVLAVAGLVVLHRMENPKSKYDDYQAVVADGAIGRGWVPPFLPRSAIEITEQHSIDANFGFISFNADAEDIERMKDRCAEMQYTEVKYLSSYPIWWPTELTGSNEVSANLDFYLCAEYGILTSLDGEKMFYWHISE
jgi:hypothetical protein